VRAELLGHLGNGQGFKELELESDCLPVESYAKMVANNLAIPVDARQGRSVRLALIPVNTPSTTQPGSAQANLVDLISIGYTMP
jgi:hypothetical protein